MSFCLLVRRLRPHWAAKKIRECLAWRQHCTVQRRSKALAPSTTGTSINSAMFGAGTQGGQESLQGIVIDTCNPQKCRNQLKCPGACCCCYHASSRGCRRTKTCWHATCDAEAGQFFVLLWAAIYNFLNRHAGHVRRCSTSSTNHRKSACSVFIRPRSLPSAKARRPWRNLKQLNVTRQTHTDNTDQNGQLLAQGRHHSTIN